MLWKNRLPLIIVFAIFLVIVLFWVSGRKDKTLTNVSSPASEEIQYDSSTDLKKELDTVNPQILDSDFGQ